MIISIIWVKSLKKTLRQDMNNDIPAVKNIRFNSRTGIKRMDGCIRTPMIIIKRKSGIKERTILTIFEKIIERGKIAFGI
jgi:hypothetical protein